MPSHPLVAPAAHNTIQLCQQPYVLQLGHLFAPAACNANTAALLSPAQPVMSFNLGSPVGDVAWAPFSATVFAAVTEAGKAWVFDLAQKRHRACCVQRVSGCRWGERRLGQCLPWRGSSWLACPCHGNCPRSGSAASLPCKSRTLACTLC